MAEQEVIKHTKKIYNIWTKKNSIWHKLKEFFLEILIIVFAVTLSIWFHDRSEHKHQQQEVKEFLLGLKDDLTNDIKEMKEDKQSFIQSGAAFNYIRSIKLNETLSPDTINRYRNSIFNTTGLVPNSGRFEGFKSSGKMGAIENKILQNDIMDLYQENIPGLLLSTDYYTSKKRMLFDYIAKNEKRETDSTTNIYKVLGSEESLNRCGSLTYVNEIIVRYDTCINKMNKIIFQIGEAYRK